MRQQDSIGLMGQGEGRYPGIGHLVIAEFSLGGRCILGMRDRPGSHLRIFPEDSRGRFEKGCRQHRHVPGNR